MTRVSWLFNVKFFRYFWIKMDANSATLPPPPPYYREVLILFRIFSHLNNGALQSLSLLFYRQIRCIRVKWKFGHPCYRQYTPENIHYSYEGYTELSRRYTTHNTVYTVRSTIHPWPWDCTWTLYFILRAVLSIFNLIDIDKNLR